MPITPQQRAAFAELQRRGALSQEQEAAFAELVRRADSAGADASRSAARANQGGGQGVAMSQAASGILRGVNSVVGAPRDALTGITNLMSRVTGDAPIEGAYGGSEWLNEQATRGGLIAEPETVGDEMAQRMFQEIGAAAFPVAGMVGLAGRAARPATTLLGRVGDAMIQPFRTAPAKTTAAELGLAGAAGAGAAIAQQAAPGNALAEFGGQMAGAMAPAAAVSMATRGPTGLAVRAASDPVRQMLPERYGGISQAERAQRAGMQVNSVIGDQVRDRAPQMAQAAAIAERIPGFNPTTAEAARLPSLATNQSYIQERLSGQDLDALAARREANVQAIEQFAEASAPDSTNLPSVIFDPARNRRDNLLARVEEDQASVLSRRQELADGVNDTDPGMIGQMMRDLLDEERVRASQSMKQRQQELGLNDVDQTFDFTPYAEAILRGLRPDSPAAAETQVSPLQETLDRLLTEQPEALRNFRLRDMVELYKTAGRYRRGVEGAADTIDERIRNAEIGRQAVERAIADITATLDPAIARNYQTWRKEYYQTVIAPFKNPPVYKARRKDGRGFYYLADEMVARSFWNPRNPQAVEEFLGRMGRTPEQAQRPNDLIRAAALDSLRTASVVDGVIDPKRFQTWLRRHEDILRRTPQLRADLQGLETANSALVARQGQLDARKARIDAAVLVKRIRSIDRDTTNIDTYLRQAIQSPQRMQRLVTSIRGDDAAMSALRRAVWDYVPKDSPAQIRQTLRRHEGTIKPVLGAVHMKALDDIATAMEMLATVPPPRGRAQEADLVRQVQERTGFNPMQAASRAVNVQSGRLSARVAWADASARFMNAFNQRQVEDAMRAALLDREVAETMLSALGKGPDQEKAIRRLRAYMLTAVAANDALDEPPQE